jgi:hypothetical protein
MRGLLLVAAAAYAVSGAMTCVTCGGCPSADYRDVNPPVTAAPLPSAPILPAGLNTTMYPPPRKALIMQNNASEVIVQPVQPSFPASNFTDYYGCPHQQAGLRNWHDASIWASGAVPMTPGMDITLPHNMSVLISSCSIPADLVFGTVTIPADSALILADANITLHAHGFILQGAFLAGSATCRLRSYINVTLHGTRPRRQAIRDSLEWTKGFAVTGRIELHGALYSATWSRLAQEVLPGDRVVFTQDSLNWEPGQNVVLTTTALKDARDFSEMETFNITRIWRLSANHPATAVELSRPVKYRHYVGKEYQAELALLSRRLTVQGSETDSEPTDIYPIACTTSYGSSPCGNSSLTGYGGHIMVMGSAVRGGTSLIRLWGCLG